MFAWPCGSIPVTLRVSQQSNPLPESRDLQYCPQEMKLTYNFVTAPTLVKTRN
jgi:hypothetical protein